MNDRKPASPAKQRYMNEYNAEHYDRITIRTPKAWGVKEQAKARAERLGKSLAGYLAELVMNDLQNEI